MSKQKHERGGARGWSEQCGVSEWVRGAREERSEWSGALCVDSIVILPRARRPWIAPVITHSSTRHLSLFQNAEERKMRRWKTKAMMNPPRRHQMLSSLMTDYSFHSRQTFYAFIYFWSFSLRSVADWPCWVSMFAQAEENQDFPAKFANANTASGCAQVPNTNLLILREQEEFSICRKKHIHWVERLIVEMD